MKASYVAAINKESHVDITALGQGPWFGTYHWCEQVMMSSALQADNIELALFVRFFNNRLNTDYRHRHYKPKPTILSNLFPLYTISFNIVDNYNVGYKFVLCVSMFDWKVVNATSVSKWRSSNLLYGKDLKLICRTLKLCNLP